MAVSTAAASGPRASRAPAPDRGLRVIHVGVLGLGSVGQAVVRAAAASAGALGRRGLAVAIDAALVRDVAKPRRCPAVPRVTDNVEAFMRGRYDVVIDALAGCEPAGAIAGRLLGKGIPVVSANKVLVAAEGPRLRKVAARGGTSLRIEACVMAGVPFLGGFERRPFAADVTRFAGIVNGTSHFILSSIAAGTPFDAALARAQALGYAEPDPSADLSGRDAREKLIILAGVLLDCELPPAAVEPEGIAGITPEALAAAAALGGVLKPIVAAGRHGAGGVTAFVGPAWMPAAHPLASVSGRDNAIVIDSRFSGRLLFAGPGAGPDVTAATLLDDAIEAAGESRSAQAEPSRRGARAAVHPIETGWFLRVTGTGADAARASLASLVSGGLSIGEPFLERAAVSMLAATAPADRVRAAAAAVRAQGLDLTAWRALNG